MLALFHSMYATTPVHPGFVTEDLEHPFGEPAEPVPASVRQIERPWGRDADAAAGTRIAAPHSPGTRARTGAPAIWSFLCRARIVRGVTVAYIVTQSPDASQIGRVTVGGAFLFGVLPLSALLVTGMNWLRSRREMRVISQYVGKGIYVVDRNGVISYANPAAAALLGFKVDELLGWKAHDLLHAESNGQSVPGGGLSDPPGRLAWLSTIKAAANCSAARTAAPCRWK